MRGQAILAAALIACLGSQAIAFDLQGHRGARGLRPENTIPAFAEALSLGVTTLETDLAVTKDNVLVLSHDPLLNPEITRDASGRWLTDHRAVIRTLTLAELKAFDVGRINPKSPYAARFPRQLAIDHTPVPTLSELIALAARSDPGVRFNIETKISPDHPEEAPDPETFARLVVEEVRKAKLEARATIQSFDWRTLVAVRRLAPEIKTSCLTVETDAENTVRSANGRPSPWLAGLDPANFQGSVPRLVQAAGCQTWSPFWKDIAQHEVAEAKAIGLSVVPWTVNSADDIRAVIALKVDGLITDYPDVARQVLSDAPVQAP